MRASVAGNCILPCFYSRREEVIAIAGLVYSLAPDRSGGLMFNISRYGMTDEEKIVLEKIKL